MKAFLNISALAAGAATVAAQSNSSATNGCEAGFFPGTDTVLFTVPYTYAQVLSIIGDYQNLTWSGNPINTVTLNGTDNTVGTARTYNNSGAHIVETITKYSKPPSGPYEEIHALALITIPAVNLTAYADYDGATVTSVCNGAASAFNLTINFCASNAALATVVFHQTHLTDVKTVGTFLGGQNFSSCATLSNTTAGTNTTNGTSIPSTPTNGAAAVNMPLFTALILAVTIGTMAVVGL